MQLSDKNKNFFTRASNGNSSLSAHTLVLLFLAISIVWWFVSGYVQGLLESYSWGADINFRSISSLIYIGVIGVFLHVSISRGQQFSNKTDSHQLSYYDACLYPIFILDRSKLTILDANPAATKLYGFSRNEFLKKRIQSFQEEPVEPVESVKQEASHKNRSNQSFKVVMYWQSMLVDGAEVYCLHVLNFLGVIPDGSINLSWEANEKFLLQKMKGLEESLGRLASQIAAHDSLTHVPTAGTHSSVSGRGPDLAELVDSLDDVVWCFNVQDMQFEFLSSSIARVFEISREDLLKDRSGWESCMYPPDRSIIPQRLEAIAKAASAEHQFRIVTASGKVKWVSEHLKMVRDDQGNLIRIRGVTRDITLRRQNEEALRHRQSLLDSVFNNGHEDFLVLNREGVVIIFNQRSRRPSAIFNSTPEPGKSFFSSLVRDQYLIIENRFRQMLITKSTISEEVRIDSGDGNPIWYTYSFVPVLDDSGEVRNVCFRGRDITDSKGMENAFHMTKKNMEALINNTADWLWSVDHCGRLTTVNDALRNYFRYQHSIVLDLRKCIPQTGPFDEKWARNLDLALKGQQMRMTGRYEDTQGEARYFEATLNPIWEKGVVVGAACFLHDTTMAQVMLQKSIELNRRFRLVSKAANDAVWEWKKNSNRILWNRAISTVFGYKPGDIPDFISLIDLVHPDDRTRFSNDLTCHAEAGERVWSSRLRFLAADGNYRHVLCRVYMHYLKNDPEIIVGSLQDITRLVEAEQAERLGNERYQLAARATGDAVYEHDINTNTISWSEGYRDLFKYEVTNESGEHWLEKIHPDDCDKIRTSYQSILDSCDATSWRGEYRLRRKDGSYAYVFDRGFVVRNESGKPLRVIGAVMDQTEKMKYIAEIRKLSTVASRTNSLVLICRDDFTIEWANESFLREMGVGLDGITNKPAQQFFSERLENPFAFSTIMSCLSAGENGMEELGIRDATGSVSWWRLDASPTQTHAGLERQFIMILTNISEQKEYEGKILNVARELANLIERANAVIFGVDRNGYVNEWNKVTAAVTGYSKNEVLGRKLVSVISGIDESHPVIAGLTSDKSISNVEFVFPSKDGKEIMLLINATPRRDVDGVVTGALIVGQDVTELVEYRNALERKVEERTRELNEALQQQIELVNMNRRFVSVASHEFRTPLSTINFSATYLRRYGKKISEVETEHKLATIQQQVKHMSFLLEDVLTISKNESNKIKVNLVSVDIAALLSVIAKEVSEAHGNSHVVSVTQLHDQPGYHMPGDPNLLRNIFVNLINNAIKFSPGKDRVAITIGIADNSVVFTVKDDGIGIPPEDIPKVFDAFHRGGNSSGIQGTGLGLNIVKRAVELLSGSISIESTPGMGSTFTVRLPILS